MGSRVFAVLAAAFLVASVAIAALTIPGLTLAEGLSMVDRNGPRWVQEHSAPWLWTWVEIPFLVRPLWLIPACLGLICAGMATTLNHGGTSPRRRRS